MANLYAEHARELLGLDDTFHVAAWRSLDLGKREAGHPDNRLRVEMMQCPRLEDGRLAWPMADTKTKKKCIFTNAEHDAWILTWEQRTGKCSLCHPRNPGQEWMGWSKDTGDKFRTCPRCNGTNKAPHLPTQATA
jgi:hypothetical protein